MNPDDLRLPKYGRVDHIDVAGYDRLIAIGDIHGCASELSQLLFAAKLGSHDLVVSLGDLVDRGPQSDTILGFMADQCLSDSKWRCVLANHEEKHIKYRRHRLLQAANPSYRNPMREMIGAYLETHESLADEDLAWAATLPVAITMRPDPNGPLWILSHAGVHPRDGLKMPSSGIIRICYVDTETLQPKPHVWINDVSGPPPGATHWSNLYSGPERVIYGHAVLSRDLPVVRNNTYAIDTGCCFGGRLSAAVFDLKNPTAEPSFIQVQAKQPYAAPGADR